MTILTEAIVSGPHPGNDLNTSFGFAFKIFTDSDVEVIHEKAGVRRVAVLNTDYVVSRNADQNNNPGGEITWRMNGVTVVLPAGESITISSRVPMTQQTTLPSGGSYNAKVIENMVDKVTILVKQMWRYIQRGLRQPVSDVTLLEELPPAADRRGRYLFFEDTVAAQPRAVLHLDLSASPATAFMASVLTSANAEAARTALGAIGGDVSEYSLLLIAEEQNTGWKTLLEMFDDEDPADIAAAADSGAATEAARRDHVHRFQEETFIVAASDESTNITAGAGKMKFRMPYSFELRAVRGSLSAAQPSGATFTVDVNENGVSILSTKLTIDNTETTSTTAAAPPVISDPTLAEDAEISIDVDAIGAAGAKGLKVMLIGRRAG